jgi:eukaryotic-like serine/threonine-protein kinase
MAEGSVDPRIGTVLQGRYRIEARLGSGGMGVVYRGERLGLERPVAIKFLHREMSTHPDALERFEREAKAMSRLHHPHCVPVIDFGVDDAPYLILEYVDGETLSRVLAGPRLPLKRALTIMRQILSGLAHAHAQGVIHRDIKPDNVILAAATGTGDHARLLDFGLAKLSETPGTATSATIAIGTPSYMSPEQARGMPVDARADLYSCGVLLFQMLTGKKPFVADDMLDVLRMHVDQPAPRLSDAVPGESFSPELETAVAGALAKDPAQRYGTALAFAAALDGIASQTSQAPVAIESSKPPREEAVPQLRRRPVSEVVVAPPPRRGRLVGLMFWVIVLLIIAGLAAAIYFQDQPLP